MRPPKACVSRRQHVSRMQACREPPMCHHRRAHSRARAHTHTSVAIVAHAILAHTIVCTSRSHCCLRRRGTTCAGLVRRLRPRRVPPSPPLTAAPCARSYSSSSRRRTSCHTCPPSPDARRARHARAVRRGFHDLITLAHRRLRAPAALHARAKYQVRALSLHALHNVVTNTPHHFGATAAIAARPAIGKDATDRALTIHRKAARSRHRWTDLLDDDNAPPPSPSNATPS